MKEKTVKKNVSSKKRNPKNLTASASRYFKLNKSIDRLFEKIDKKEKERDAYLIQNKSQFISKIQRKENWLKKRYKDYEIKINHLKIDDQDFLDRIKEKNSFLMKPFVEMEYEFLKDGSKLDETILSFKKENSITPIPCFRAGERLIFKNPLEENPKKQLQTWKVLYSLSGMGNTKYKRHRRNDHLYSSGRPEKSRFLKVINLPVIEKMEKLAFIKGIGTLNDKKVIYFYLKFKQEIGIGKKKEKLKILCVQVERDTVTDKKKKNVLFIHGYPTNESEMKSKVGNLPLKEDEDIPIL